MTRNAAGAQGSGKREPRGGLHGVVTQAIARRILSSAIAPGAVLPSEPELCALLSVSRSSVREAIRVLASKGLVESRSRSGTRVRPREDWNLLDPDVLGWSAELPPDIAFVKGLIEARRIFEPSAAELAARRATAHDLAAIEAAYLGMVATLRTDVEACAEADLVFHAAILRATHNPVLSQLASIIGAALESTFRLTTSASTSYARTIDAHGEVLDAIRMRDAPRARAAMLGLIEVAADDLGGVIEKLATLPAEGAALVRPPGKKPRGQRRAATQERWRPAQASAGRARARTS